jgi:hypothetical protein
MQALPNSSGPMGYAQPNTALPLVSVDNNDAGEFDYSAFLQQDELGYLAGESSDSTISAHLPPISPSSGPSSDSSLQLLGPRQQHLAPSTAMAAHPRGNAARIDSSSSLSPEAHAPARQRLERRGHTKSRRGCFNCKRRRIKVSYISGGAEVRWEKRRRH